MCSKSCRRVSYKLKTAPVLVLILYLLSMMLLMILLIMYYLLPFQKLWFSLNPLIVANY